MSVSSEFKNKEKQNIRILALKKLSVYHKLFMFFNFVTLYKRFIPSKMIGYHIVMRPRQIKAHHFDFVRV